jgi:hypothetical protein
LVAELSLQQPSLDMSKRSGTVLGVRMLTLMEAPANPRPAPTGPAPASPAADPARPMPPLSPPSTDLSAALNVSKSILKSSTISPIFKLVFSVSRFSFWLARVLRTSDPKCIEREACSTTYKWSCTIDAPYRSQKNSGFLYSQQPSSCPGRVHALNPMTEQSSVDSTEPSPWPNS